MPASARIRLRRLRPEAVYKEESGQLTVPLAPGEEPVEALSALLGELVPGEGAGAVTAAADAGGRSGSPGRDSSRAAARR
jgi:hypothetical protein